MKIWGEGGEGGEIALNVLCEKKTEFCPAYISIHNSNRNQQIIIFMISNGKVCHYL